MAARSARRLLCAADVAAIDQRSVALDVPGGRLMEAAGRQVAEKALSMLAQSPQGAVAVLCGPGNNGGDGFVAARLLAARGRAVSLWAMEGPPPSAEARAAREAWECSGGETRALAETALGGTVLGETVLGDADLLGAALVIDALFGVGLGRKLDGVPARLAERLVEAGAPAVLSVDMPSGVCSDTGRVRGTAFRADATVTFVAPKRGHFLGDGALLSGELSVVSIGAPESALSAASEDVFEIAPETFPAPLAKTRPDAHKYDYGHAVIAAGGMGATGAARLAALGALRAGAGLVAVTGARRRDRVHLVAAPIRGAR